MAESGDIGGAGPAWTARRGLVNLTTWEAGVEEVLPDEQRLWCGGRGLNAAVMRNELPEGLKPFNPDVPLVFSAGLLAGSGVPCAGALYAATLVPGPVPPNYGTLVLQGSLGTALKRAGLAQIVIRGAAEHPVFLEVGEDGVRFHDAADLWGLDPVSASVAMQERIRNPQAAPLAIGPAGENRSRIASLLADFAWPADGLGFGAALGGKNLKGIVFHGGNGVRPWDRRRFEKGCRALRSAVAGDAGMRMVADRGPALPLQDRAGAPGRASFANFASLRRLATLDGLARRAGDPRLACTGCPCACNTDGLRRGREGRRRRIAGLGTEALLDLGPRIEVRSWDRTVDLTGEALQRGLDPAGVGALASWLSACRAQGLLSSREAGDGVSFRDADAVSSLMRALASREGAGRYLGEGALRAGKRIGGEAQGLLVSWCGVDWPGADPRVFPGAALAFASAPFDPDVFLYVNLLDCGDLAVHYLEDVSDPETEVRKRQERRALADSLGVCSLPLAALPVWNPEDLLEVTHALTGLEPSSTGSLGKRVLALERMLRTRKGSEVPGRLPGVFEDGSTWAETIGPEDFLASALRLLGGEG